MKIAILLGCLLSVTSAVDQRQSAKLKTKGEPEDENSYISYDPKRSIRSVLSDYPGDFGSDLF